MGIGQFVKVGDIWEVYVHAWKGENAGIEHVRAQVQSTARIWLESGHGDRKRIEELFYNIVKTALDDIEEDMEDIEED